MRTGGYITTPDFDKHFGNDIFAVTIERCLGRKMRESDKFCERVWGSLANVIWIHPDYKEFSYSFSAAGDMISSILGKGCYLDWYGCMKAGCIDDEFARELANLGWYPVIQDRKYLKNHYSSKASFVRSISNGVWI